MRGGTHDDASDVEVDVGAGTSDELVDELALVGPRSHVAEQLEAWRQGPITTLIVEPTREDAIEHLAELW